MPAGAVLGETDGPADHGGAVHLDLATLEDLATGPAAGLHEIHHDIDQDPVVTAQLDGQAQAVADSQMRRQYSSGQNLRPTVSKDRQRLGVTGLDQGAQPAPDQSLPAGLPVCGHFECSMGVVLGDVVEVVAD